MCLVPATESSEEMATAQALAQWQYKLDGIEKNHCLLHYSNTTDLHIDNIRLASNDHAAPLSRLLLLMRALLVHTTSWNVLFCTGTGMLVSHDCLTKMLTVTHLALELKEPLRAVASVMVLALELVLAAPASDLVS